MGSSDAYGTRAIPVAWQRSTRTIPRPSLVRLESLVAEATQAPEQALIGEVVDVVVFIDEDGELAAGRKVRELMVVTWFRSRDGQETK